MTAGTAAPDLRGDPLDRSGISALTLGSYLLLFAGLLMWGGVGQFDSAPELQLGPLRYQDLLFGAGVLLCAGPFVMRTSWPRRTFFAALGPAYFLVAGVIIGHVQGNSTKNIAGEIRPLMFELAGVWVGAMLGTDRVSRLVQRFALALAAAFVAQFLLLVLRPGLDPFISGASAGNVFTLNVPIVRPAGGFHLLGAGFAIAALTTPIERWRWPVVVLGAGIVVTQSKTYWLIAFAITVMAVLRRENGKVQGRRLAYGAMVFFSAILAAGTAAVIAGGTGGITAPFEKFALVFENPAVANVVLSKRVDELGMMRRALHSSTRAVIVGRGLGYVYRDEGALYFREDPRDRERLAMFGHNYPGWLLVKSGILGVTLVVVPLLFFIGVGFRSGGAAKSLATAAAVLVASSLSSGSLENVPAALTVGLALGAISTVPKAIHRTPDAN